MSTLQMWLRTWAGLGVPGSERLRDLFAETLARYAEPHRFYHTGRHLAECFERWSELRGQAGHPAEVEAALWFHDAVYDPRSQTNELRSAELAREAALGLGVDSVPAQRIYGLVMSTRHAGMPNRQDEGLIVDVDLSILGADPDRFAEYEGQIRSEYVWVPEHVFREQRSHVLRSFLGRPYIFSTDLFRKRYEQQARENIRQSLARLS